MRCGAAGLRQPDRLVHAEAIAAWRAEPRSTRGGQPHYSDLAIATALTLRAVFRLALRQTEGLIRSILCLLGLDLAMPDHSTMSRRARSLELPRIRPGRRGVHLLVDSTGLRLCRSGEWLVERHGARTRRLWRKLHHATDADTGQIVVAELTEHHADDGVQVEALLDSYGGPIASFTADGAYDRDDVYAAVAARSRSATVSVPLGSTAVIGTAGGAPLTQRDQHVAGIAAHGRMGWQRRSGYDWRALVEADVSRWKRVIGDGLRSRTDGRRSTQVAIAARALNQMLELGRPEYVRIG